MVAARQMMFGGVRRNDETVIDVQFEEYEVGENYCQLQVQIERRTSLFDAVTVDWGDGTVDLQTAYLAWHNYRAAGKYTIRIGKECRWFRIWGCYTVNARGRKSYARPQMWLRQWGDWIESAEGSFCGWSDSVHGGLRGPLPPWGRSITSTYCCYEYCTDVDGSFPAWTDAITDATGTYQHVVIGGPVPKWGKNVVSANSCFYRCPNVTGPLPAWPSGCETMNSCYYGCTNIAGEIPPWPAAARELESVYKDCTGLSGVIPAWPEGITSVNGCYWNCAGLAGAWTDDPALLMPEEKLRYEPDSDYYRCYDVVTGCSGAVRSLFWDVPWGGTIPRPASAPTVI